MTTYTQSIGYGHGSFQNPALYRDPHNNQATDLTWGDVNGDHKLDLIAVGIPYPCIYLGTGNGGFGAGTSVTQLFATSLVATDINGDNALDLVTGLNAQVRYAVGNGAGVFDAHPTSVSISDNSMLSLDAGNFDLTDTHPPRGRP